jgi:hypothetical protein
MFVGMNGYRPIVELMNTNFGIYGMAEISSAGEPVQVPSLIEHKYVMLCIGCTCRQHLCHNWRSVCHAHDYYRSRWNRP